MESPFIYNKYVTGKNFIGRKGDITILGNLMSAGENVSIYEPPRSGKTSAIQQAFFNMRIQGKRFAIAEVNMTATRSIGQLLLQLGDSCIRAFASTPGEYADIAGRLLQGTHLVFDPQSYAETDSILSLTWDVDDEDIRAVFRLPYRLAADNSMKLFVIIDEFQNVNLTENGDKICKILESVMKEVREVGAPLCSFLLCGSQVNAMKEIFEHRRFFYRQVEHFALGPVEDKEIIEHIVKGFLASGKVIDRDLLLGVCRLFKGHLWYINHFISICD
ncbi:MAG: ATP-binding protein, partial [Bacteroidales bacterium]|nr:ATP-binding protein [Bacteroidales bacterium]